MVVDNGPGSARRWLAGTVPTRTVLTGAALLIAIALIGCAPTVTGAAVPATVGPTSTSHPTSTITPPPTTPPTTSPPPARPVTAACPLLSAEEVGTIYNLTVGAQEGQPLSQSGVTTYNCSYVNGAKQQLAALQVIVDPTATGDPTQYLDGYLHPFLAPGESGQPISGLGAAAASYLKSDRSGPLAFVVATVRSAGSGLDLVQFLASTSNANDPTAQTQMVKVLRLALNRL